MAKYYVSSGDLRTVIDRPTPMEALVDAFRSQALNCDHLGSLTMISETGFDEYKDETAVYPTEKLLELAQLEHEFQPHE